MADYLAHTLEKSLHTVWTINEVLSEDYFPPKNQQDY